MSWQRPVIALLITAAELKGGPAELRRLNEGSHLAWLCSERAVGGACSGFGDLALLFEQLGETI